MTLGQFRLARGALILRSSEGVAHSWSYTPLDLFNFTKPDTLALSPSSGWGRTKWQFQMR
jgi:hypothetical protein